MKIDSIKQQEVAQTIADIEAHTDAELVAVLARQSDDYRYIPLLWASFIALILPLPLLFLPIGLKAGDLLTLQWATFLVMTGVFCIPALRIHLIPKSVRYFRASNMARRQFLENNLHHTRGATGILIFVSEAERYVEIIADRGINQMVEQTQWQQLVDDFVASIKAGKTHEGLATCINGCGEILKRHVPATHVKNELPNRLVML